MIRRFERNSVGAPYETPIIWPAQPPRILSSRTARDSRRWPGAWASLPGGDVETAGSVHFRPLKNSRGTEIEVSLKYNPPAGKMGAHLATLLGEGLEEKVNEDLATFKQVMETGMAPAPSVG